VFLFSYGRWWPTFLNCLRIHVGLNKPTKRKQLAWLRDALKALADSLIEISPESHAYTQEFAKRIGGTKTELK
jgi:hypothetical protein